MKLRKLILSTKLREIEKQNQNMFVFHCNLTAKEWQELKNLLCHNNRDLVGVGQKHRPQRGRMRSTSTHLNSNNYQILFLSKYPDRPRIESSKTFIENVQHSKERAQERSAILKVPKKNNRTQLKLAGCLLFFNEKSKDLVANSQESRLKPSELLKKLESSDFKNNLFLLYGQVNSIPLNHLDLKRVLQLDSQETHQQLLFSIQLLSASLNSVLYQNINEFIRIQEQFSSNSSQSTKIKSGAMHKT